MKATTSSDKLKAQGAKTAAIKASAFKDPKVEKFIVNLQKAFGTYDVKKHKSLIDFLKEKSKVKMMFYVDFNEMVENDLVLLSASDVAKNANGIEVLLVEGMQIHIYSDDVDSKGNPDRLVATGVVERNIALDWSKGVKWCCRINAAGIHSENDPPPTIPV